VIARRLRGQQVRVPGQRADAQLARGALDVAQAADPVDVDEHLGLRQPQLHHRDQAVSAGQDPAARRVPREQGKRVVDA